jgi:hypothetical protein
MARRFVQCARRCGFNLFVTAASIGSFVASSRILKCNAALAAVRKPAQGLDRLLKACRACSANGDFGSKSMILSNCERACTVSFSFW